MTVKKAVQAQDANFVERGKRFFRNVLAELKKVHWPDRKQLVTYTGVVLGAVLLMSLIIWVMDTLLNGLLSLIL